MVLREEVRTGEQSSRTKSPNSPAIRYNGTQVGRLLRRRAKSLLESIASSPLESAAIASPPIALLIFAVQGGSAAFHSLLSNPAEATVQVVVASVWCLLAKQSISSIRAEMRATKTRNREANIVKTTGHVGHLMADMVERFDRLDGQIHEFGNTLASVAVKQMALTVTSKNIKETWGPLVPESTYTLVGPQSRFDLKHELKLDGKVSLIPDIDRLRTNMLPRFKPGSALSRVNYVLFVGGRKKARGVPVAIEQQLTMFRALQQVARSDGVELLLDRARFFLVEGLRPPKSFFVGEYARNGMRIPFVNVYTDHATMYGVPQSLLDDNVDTTYIPRVVVDHEYLANVLMSSVPALTLADLEERYGHLVADPDFKFPKTKAHSRAVSMTSVIDFGDGSFNI